MEKPVSPHGSCSCGCFSKGVDVTPNASNWDSLGDICTDVVGCFSGPSGKRLIVHFSLPGSHISVDIRNVKAAGVLCVLGISFGIGTYVLYKIYDKFFRPSVRKKKPKKGDLDYEPVDAEDEEICQILKGRDDMGNQQSSPVDIPVYYKAGFGVSLYKPVDYTGTGKVRNRKNGANTADALGSIINGSLNTRNGLTAVEHANTDAECLVNGHNNENHARNLDQLRIEIDESGFVEDDAGVDNNGDNLSNSLKGNFSPTSLHEKNLRFDDECSSHSEHSTRNDILNANNDKRPNVNHLNLGPKLGKSSVLLTPPSEDESSGSHPAKSSSHTGPASSHSTKSDVSDIHSEIAEHQPIETDEEREQLSPLPYDRSAHNTPERICSQKLKLKLGAIVSRSASQSANSSGCSSPDSFLLSNKFTGSSDNRESSLSGISSPDLELLNSENGDPALDASTFNELEDEIHGVENEFETLSKEIQALSSKYSNQETGSHIFKEIFQRYPSIRIRQSEKGIHFSHASESDTESVSHSGAMEEDKDLSWDLENLLDAVYSEGSDSGMVPFSKTGRQSTRSSSTVKTGTLDNSGNVSYMDNSSINCSVDLGGSLYEDEFHLHLGTKALPKIVEQSPDTKNPCDIKFVTTPDTDYNETSQCSMQDGTSLHTDSSKTGTSLSCANSEHDIDVFEHAPGTNLLDTGYCSMEIGTSPVDNVAVTCTSQCLLETLPTSPVSPDNFSEAASSSGSQMCSPVNISAVCNLGERVSIEEYADEEWKGETSNAKLIREAYLSIPSHCECCHLRRIRGDNYCGIRSTLYQTLVNGLPPLNIWASKTEAFEGLNRAYNRKSSGIHRWNFAKRISYNSENRLEIMHKCLTALYDVIEEMNEHSSYSEREQFLVDIFNSDLDSDLDLMEGVKLLMLLSALHLHNDMEQGDDVPVFAWLLFARDTSENMSSFVRNHLNHVGDSGGLEQVEMCLLGYCLGVRIRVFRLKQFKDEDFISYYPEDGTDDWPVVSLIAEDDRHYNVPVL
ncbi:hypothetical protein ACF0H5_015594 [Mactra antiquata]